MALLHQIPVCVDGPHAIAMLDMPGVGTFCTPDESDFVSMAAVELPQPPGWKPGYHGSPDPLQVELRDRHQIEIPVGSWNGRRFLRVSAHLYTTPTDIECLLAALWTESGKVGTICET